MVKEKVKSIRARVALALGLLTVLSLGAFASAASAAQDYSELTRGFADELRAALPVGLAAVGLFIGVMMAYKVVRRVLRA